jgi:hypothetical protein
VKAVRQRETKRVKHDQTSTQTNNNKPTAKPSRRRKREGKKKKKEEKKETEGSEAKQETGRTFGDCRDHVERTDAEFR